MNEVIYRSIFANEFQELVELKRSLGFKYETEAGAFKRIDSFFISCGLDTKTVSKDICSKWCEKRTYESPANHAARISAMRVFCRYLNDIGIAAYVPPSGITKHPPKYDAHIYTDEELKLFFAEVDKSQSVPSECPYRAQIMPVFFRILYTSGLRVSELRLLRVKDFDLEKGYIHIRDAKNHKERLVPVHTILVEKSQELKQSIHKSSSDDEYFFMIMPGRPMTLGNIYHNFRRYIEKAGIPHTGHGPRVHDFRHTYCVNLLRKWSDEGKDLLAYLPYMKTMLGHESFEETAYYLKLTAERFPYIKEKLKASFPDLISEVTVDEHEFY